MGSAAVMVGLLALATGLLPAAAAAAPATPSTSYPYLKNFRTTQLSGRFLTKSGAAIPNAIVNLSLHQIKDSGPEVQQMPLIVETHTDAAGAFAFAVPRTAVVLAAARANHGNLNLIIRAMKLPTVAHGQAASGAAATAAGPSSTNGTTSVAWPSCPPQIACGIPPEPTLPSVPNVAPYGTHTPQHYVAFVSTWAGTLVDPFSMYPRELVSVVDKVRNLNLYATDGVALLTGNAGAHCITSVTPTCPYNPVEAANAYPQDALPPGTVPASVNTEAIKAMQQVGSATGTSDVRPPDEPGYCDDGSESVYAQEYDWVPVTDMHAYWDVQVQITVDQSTTTTIGVGVHDQSDNGNWTVDGNTSNTTGQNWTSGWYGPAFAERWDEYHLFYAISHDDQCYAGTDSWDFFWDEISDQGWKSGEQTDGSDLSYLDGADQQQAYSNYSAPFDSDGNGGIWSKYDGQGYHFGAEIGAFGVSLGGETDWNQQVVEKWQFGYGAATHWLFGHDGTPDASQVVYSR
jgi:hypothetical protein